MATATKRTAKSAASNQTHSNNNADAALNAAQDAAEGAMKAAAEGYEKAIEMSNEQVEKARAAMFDNADEVSTFARDNAEAVRQSSAVLATAFEDAGRQWMGFAKAAFDEGFATVGRMASAKDPQAAASIQVAWAEESVNRLVEAGGAMQELSRTVAEQAAAPITDRATAIYQRFGGTR